MREKVNILTVDDQPGKLPSYEAILAELGEVLIKATRDEQQVFVSVRDDGTGYPDTHRNVSAWECWGRHRRDEATSRCVRWRGVKVVASIARAIPKSITRGPSAGQQHVGRLQVAVDHPGRVDRLERLGHARHQQPAPCPRAAARRSLTACCSDGPGT